MKVKPDSERMWFMPPSPAPADPGWDDDLAWLDRDPMTAAEREEWLGRVCEQDEPPEPEEFEDVAPLTAGELAEIREAAADELLAVEAATTGRRGPGQPGSARPWRTADGLAPAAYLGGRPRPGRMGAICDVGCRRGPDHRAGAASMAAATA
jgi:hypothetical protein